MIPMNRWGVLPIKVNGKIQSYEVVRIRNAEKATLNDSDFDRFGICTTFDSDRKARNLADSLNRIESTLKGE